MAVRAVVRGPQPVNAQLDLGLWRPRRIRLLRQTEVAECGVASLAMIADYHGLATDLGTLRRMFKPSLRGVTLKSLMSMADLLGLTTRAVKVSLEQLSSLHLPAILHWDLNHYVVIEKVANGAVYILNPEGTARWWPLADVSTHFTGVALELRPGEKFEPIDRRERLRLPQLWRRITGLKRAIVQTIVLSLVLEAFVLASPYYLQVALDNAMTALDRDLLTVLALGFGLFTLLNSVASLLRSFVLLSAGTALGYGIASNIARRLFRLPIAWFEKRHIGDILSRFQSVTPIQQFMTQGALSTVIDGSLTVFTLALMFVYAVDLALIALTAFAIYAVVRAITFSMQRRAQEEIIVATGKEQSTLIETLRGIVTLRLFSRETSRHALWQGRLTDSTNANVSLARIGIWQTTTNTLVFGIENILSVWLAVRLVIDGGFSVGMLFAFMAYKTQFLQRAASLIDQSVAFRMLGLHLERLSDIALADQDKSSGEVGEPRSLGGGVGLSQVRYRYSPTDPFVLDGVTFSVDPGEHVAITGPSGGGKSTLVKILLSLVDPDEGDLLVDGHPIDRFGRQSYRDQVSAVLQEDSLFAGSLADNIALFDEAPDTDLVISCSKAAAIHDEIVAMPMGYDTLVGDMGSSLSGGQKQRILLARALYRNPRILVMDEGTSQLDTTREKRVNAAIGALGITRIIIAHRLETIASASRILAVEHGKVSDVTHRFAVIKQHLGEVEPAQARTA